MDDREFVSLDPPAAQAALRTVSDPAERARLERLYAGSRGFLVDGTGWKPPGQKPSAGRKPPWEGRTNRAQYWLVMGVVAAFYAALMSAPGIGHASVSEIVLLFICIPRLHDIGLSGWIAAGVFGAEIVCAIAAFSLLPMDLALAAMGLFVIAVGLLLIVLGTLPGQKLANRFGLPPAAGLRFGRTVDVTERTASDFD